MAESKVRLVVCPVCKTIEEIPDYSGPLKYDYLLDAMAVKHSYGAGQPHVGLILFDVDQTEWNNSQTRLKIIEQVKERNGAGLGDEFYSVKETFKEDAMTCWKQHNRTRDCDDFKADNKRIVPDTKWDRKDLGLAPMKSNRFICEFCPVHTVKMQRMRAARGDYDYTI